MKWLMLVRSTACAGAVLVVVGCQAAPPDASSTEAVATEGGEVPIYEWDPYCAAAWDS